MVEFNSNLFFDDGEYEIDDIIYDEPATDGKYTTKVVIPHYEPREYCPSISEIMDTSKYEELIKHINESNVSDDNKRFLRLAAARHIVFNYARIADYYAHANKELQGLMEESALVLIDINSALANGFAKLDYRLIELAKQSAAETEDV